MSTDHPKTAMLVEERAGYLIHLYPARAEFCVSPASPETTDKTGYSPFEGKFYQTLTEAREAVDKLAVPRKKIRIDVRASYRGRNFKVVGQHSTTGDWLVHYEDGERSRNVPYQSKFGPWLDDKQKAEIATLQATITAAHTAFSDYLNSIETTPRDAFMKAVQSAYDGEKVLASLVPTKEAK